MDQRMRRENQYGKDALLKKTVIANTGSIELPLSFRMKLSHFDLIVSIISSTCKPLLKFRFDLPNLEKTLAPRWVRLFNHDATTLERLLKTICLCFCLLLNKILVVQVLEFTFKTKLSTVKNQLNGIGQSLNERSSVVQKRLFLRTKPLKLVSLEQVRVQICQYNSALSGFYWTIIKSKLQSRFLVASAQNWRTYWDSPRSATCR